MSGIEIGALVAGIINAIFAGIPLFSKLWKKLKRFFSSEESLRLQTQSVLESHLTPILRNDYALAIASQQWAQGVGTLLKSNYAGYSSGGPDQSFWNV